MARERFVTGTLYTFGSRVLTVLLGVIASAIIARSLGPQMKGIYALAALLPSLVVNFASLGLGSAAVFHTARGGISRDQILGTTILMTLFMSLVGVVGGSAVAIGLGDVVFPGVDLRFLLLALLIIPLNMFHLSVKDVMLGARSFRLYNLSPPLKSLVWIGLLIILVRVVRFGVPGALMATAGAWLAADAIAFMLSRRVAGGVSFSPNWHYVRIACKYGLQIHIVSMLAVLYYRADLILVNRFLGAEAVGYYTTSVGLSEHLTLAATAAGVILFASVAGERSENRRKTMTSLAVKSTLVLTAGGAAILAAFGRQIITLLYSSSYLPAFDALVRLLPGVMGLAGWQLLANDLAGRGFPRYNIYVALITVVMKLGLDFAWIPSFGIRGAGWASSIAYTCAFALILLAYQRVSGNRWRDVLVPNRDDVRMMIAVADRGLQEIKQLWRRRKM